MPDLGLDNQCDRPVLLLDGEELVGAKQNRILKLSLPAPAGKPIVMPVSCVEAGRCMPGLPSSAVLGVPNLPSDGRVRPPR